MFKRLFTKKRIILVIVAILVAAVYFNYSKNKNVVGVTKVELENIKVRKTISGSGIVTSRNDASLSFTSVGRLQKIYVSKGDEVTKGQLLAQLDNRSVYAALQATKDARDIALRDLDLYVENYADDMDAVGGEEAYNINIRRLNELVSKAEATYQAQISSSNDTYLYAPFSGTIIDIPFSEGETVSAGSTVIKIADLNMLTFEVNIDQEDYGYVKADLPVEIILDAYEGDTFVGKVTGLPSYVNDSENEEFLINITIPTDQNEIPILLGMKGDANIIVDETQEDVQALTFDSLYSDDNGNFVWIDENSMVNKKYIELGIEGDVYTEVKTDLSNDTVIAPINTDVVLKIGQKIKYAQQN